MPFFPAFALLLVQDKTDTYGKTNAQILAMGRTKWREFYVGKDGGVTAAESSAQGLYGDAMAWRNDQLAPKARVKRLRTLLQGVRNESIAVGSAITGGGTMWNIISASLYADAEETLYAVFSKTGKATNRKVSDVTKAIDALSTAYTATKTESWYKGDGVSALVRLRKDIANVVAEAKKLPRRDSNALLDFCKNAVEAGTSGG